MNITESIVLAFDSIRLNKLRASLTLLSIAIGVFAIIGAGTLVSSINNAVTNEIAAMGDNTFIIKRVPSVQMGMNSWRKYRHRPKINYRQVKELKRQMTSTDLVSCVSYSGSNTIKAGNFATNPDVLLIGTDENYFTNYNVSVSEGRAFTPEDISFNRNVAIIGNDVVVKVFPNENPIGKKIFIKNQNYIVIGITQSKGAILGQSQDNQVILPITHFLKYFSNEWWASITITVKPYTKEDVTKTMDEAIGLLRTIRNVKPWEENNFELETNKSIGEQFASFTGFLSIFGFVSGAIALIAAGVGIMNIMLVSVKERTREIGIRKAVGAKRFWILLQFIIETITLCQVGGLIGIIIGIGGAWGLGKLIEINIVFPLGWIIISLVICTFLGVFAGSYPAWKAAKLDPIDALRYE